MLKYTYCPLATLFLPLLMFVFLTEFTLYCINNVDLLENYLDLHIRQYQICSDAQWYSDITSLSIKKYFILVMTTINDVHIKHGIFKSTQH